MKFRKLFTALVAVCALIATPVLFTSCSNNSSSESSGFVPLYPVSAMTMENGDVITLTAGTYTSNYTGGSGASASLLEFTYSGSTLPSSSGGYSYVATSTSSRMYTLTLSYGGSSSTTDSTCTIMVIYTSAKSGYVYSCTNSYYAKGDEITFE